jgi:hypothetical protein
MATTPFIKYSPDVETADPGFDENLQTVKWIGPVRTWRRS